LSLFSEWSERFNGDDKSPESKRQYYEYLEKETEIYKELLKNSETTEKGALKELAEKFGTDEVLFTGFLDGINTSLNTELDMEELTENSEIELCIDYEKLYFNMHKAKAKWLYSLEEWEDVLSGDERARILNEYRSTVIVKSDKFGRNDPCPCGSGKKYKNCCLNKSE
jgi:uncharacterized protein YecA (UPF0149 family)